MDSNKFDFSNLNNQTAVNSCEYYSIQDFLSSFSSQENSSNVSNNSYNQSLRDHREIRHSVSTNLNKQNTNHCSQVNRFNDFSLLHINSRSISKNFDSVEILLRSLINYSFSVIGISETWLHANSPDVYNIPEYDMLHADRKEGRGGGVALYIRKDLTYKLRKDIHIHGVEDIYIELKNESGKNVIIGTLYRPPSYNVSEFLEHLDESLEKISRENKRIYLMGDYNIDLTSTTQMHDSNSFNNAEGFNDLNRMDLAHRFLNILSTHALLPCIDKPTRITASSSTLIDNIFTNTFEQRNQSGILYYDVSDHLPVFVISSFSRNKECTKTKVIMYRKESSENIKALNDDLIKEQWLDVYEENDVNTAYDKFITKLKQYYDKNIPLVKINPGRNQSINPWITKGILNSIKNRNSLYKLYLRKPSVQNHDKYKQYRNKLTKIIRKSKTMYYTKELENAEGDINSTWKVINKIINKGKSKDKIDSITVNNHELKNPSDIADAFNSFFTSVGPDLAAKINCGDIHFSRFLSRPLSKTILFDTTTQSEIITITKNFQSKRSTGYDGLSMKLIKQIIYSIAAPLEYIFSKSLSNGTCPNLLKIAKVIPIYKKEEKDKVTNYRPISLLPSLSKILEKLVYKRLLSFLTINNILNQNQFGFRKNHSTDFAIIQLLDKITDLLAKKEQIIAIYMDLSKAFDTIDHKTLLSKLNNYGIRGIALSWLKSYLSDRQQFVCIDGHNSSMCNIRCGVPQGSILGPLLFLIYVNDLMNSSSILKFVMFADDTTILASHKNLNQLIHILNSELINISSWFKCNKLSLNINKTNFMHFQSSHSNTNQLNYDIKVDGITLDKKDYTKFLGVTIDSHLTWNNHISNITSHVAKGIGILYRIKHLLPPKSLLMLYNTLILPYITYGNLIWGNCGISKLNHIFLLQKKVVRICSNSSYMTHTDPLFYRMKILKVNDINTLFTGMFMFKYTKNTLPSVFDNFFLYNRSFHSYPTRNRDNIHLNNPRLLLAHKSIRHHGPDIWNAIPTTIKQSAFLKTFKRRLKENLLHEYSADE